MDVRAGSVPLRRRPLIASGSAPDPRPTRRPAKRAARQREARILRCLLHGNSNKVIANHLGITEATVKVHLKSLLRKIDASNRTQAAIWGLDNGFAEGAGGTSPTA